MNRVETRYITRSLGPRNFVCYIRYFVISVVNEQYKTKEIHSLGLEKLVCYIRYCVISNLFITSFHCTVNFAKSTLHKSNYRLSQIFLSPNLLCVFSMVCFFQKLKM